jgi:hypothetical protein
MLYPCPDCGNQVSNEAAACPKCGRPLTPIRAVDLARPNTRGGGAAKTLVFGCGGLLLLGLVAVIARMVIPRPNASVSLPQTVPYRPPSERDPSILQKTHEDSLRFVTIKDFKPEKDGFGNILTITGRVDNENDFDVRDVEIVCDVGAPSGTRLGRKTATFYERIPSHGTRSFNLNLGFVDTQTSAADCRVTNFAR